MATPTENNVPDEGTSTELCAKKNEQIGQAVRNWQGKIVLLKTNLDGWVASPVGPLCIPMEDIDSVGSVDNPGASNEGDMDTRSDADYSPTRFDFVLSWGSIQMYAWVYAPA